MADYPSQIAQEISQIAPVGATPADLQFLGDELDLQNSTGGHGLLAGFKFPSNLNFHEFQQMVSYYEQFENNVGWKVPLKPQDLLAAMQAGAGGSQLSAQQFWAKKLPPQYGWLKHYATRSEFDAFKEQNRERVAARFGAHNVDDLHFSMDLDNQHTTNAGSGGAIGNAPQALQSSTSSGSVR